MRRTRVAAWSGANGDAVGQDGEEPQLPRTLRVAIVLLYVEAVGVAAVAGLFAYGGFASRGTVSVSEAVSTVGFTLAIAALLAFLSGRLARRKSWARGPAIVLELLFLPIGYAMASSGAAWFGIPAIGAGLACAVLLLAPSSRAGLGIR
jgi:hypothetical protein